ncbi:hypothetical protein OS242_10370 [Tumebacillus sp. DT12]|uniref:Uncharacterized protein n=1 Tax=Tumebacillus lacus TaxID=2995335 RepID=A0ABT3X325_9BACL|nr:hypothetical protein [Tumebacillus lacus]MCX7570368.1 hypothetical protein [Tumebacillus lacus]
MIQIGDDWRIISDTAKDGVVNIVIQRRDGETWADDEHGAYHPNVPAACRELLNKMVNGSDAKSLADLIAVHERAAQTIADALTERNRLIKAKQLSIFWEEEAAS